MKLTLDNKHLEELVNFCGGDTEKISNYILKLYNEDIKTIKDLSVNPIKNNYAFLIDKNKAPIFYDTYIKNRDDYERYQTITIDDILEHLEYGVIDENIIEGLTKELIDIRFGSMIYDW